MKRHIQLLVCLLVVFATVFTFAACNNNNEEEAHQHTYGDAWAVNETNHWHAATCTEEDACKSAKVSEAAHKDENTDKVCDVCGYDYDHEHTYAAEWTSDEKAHYYAVTCGCSVDAKDKASHTDANNDGTCDVCSYNGGHEHTYSDAWAMDDENHWYASECGHSVVDSEEAHDLDDAGLCTVCGWADGGIDVSTAVELGDLYAALTNGATVSYVKDTYGTAINSLIVYELGNASSMIYDSNINYDETYTYWYTIYNGAIFGVQEYGEYVSSPYAPESGLVDGYGFADVFGSDDDAEDTFFGANALVAGLYEIATGEDAVDFAEYVAVIDGETLYVFNFSTVISYTDYTGETYYEMYNVEVAFSLSDSYTYETVLVSSSKYNAAAEIDEESGDVLGYYATTLIPTTTYTYNVWQTVGDRDLEFKYDPEEILLTDYDLLDGETVIEEDIEMIAGTNLTLSLGNVAPETADKSLDSIDVAGDGISVNYWDGDITIYAGAPGEASFTVTTINTEKVYNVTVVAPAVSEIYATVNGTPVPSTGIQIYSENYTASLTFSAAVNSYANGAYTAMLSPTSSNTLTDNGDGTYTLNISTDRGGNATEMVLITSGENADVTYTLLVNVVPAPTPAEILSGNYAGYIADMRFSGYNDAIEVAFTPESEGATSGSLSVTVTYFSYMEWAEVSYTDVLSYTYSDGVITTTLTSTTYTEEAGLGYTFSINDNYELVIGWTYGESALASVDAPAAISVAGEYRYSFYNEETGSLEACYQLILNSDGTGTFKYRTWSTDPMGWTDVFTTNLTWTLSDSVENGVSITVEDSTYLQSGTYVYGEWENEQQGFTVAGLKAVVVLEGTSPVTYNIELNEAYS